MKFNRSAKSDKFDYMMLSRLIQDAKYFIEHPHLKHLWAKTLDEHIKQMKEQYAKLDPKPEWVSLEKIETLAKQMKESYKNYWNERHPDNKIEAAEQPTTPKPTQTLPDTMTWAWDPKANQWIAVMKDNPVVAPPTYNPNNIGDYASSTTYTSTSNMGYLKSSLESLKESPKFTSEIKSDKIIEDLFKNGFVQHAGYQRGKGTKISITNKGLDFLKKSYQEDYKKELKEKISLRKNANKINNKKFDAKLSWKDNLDYSDLIYNKQILASLYDDDYNKNWLIISPEGECLEKLSKKSYDINSAKIYLIKKACLKLSNNLMAKIKASSATGNESTITGLNYPNNSTDCDNGVKTGNGEFLHVESAIDDNIDKKQTILKNLVYQHNKQNGEESAIGLSLDFDNKAVATGDLENLSKLEDQLRDEEIHCNITPRKDFPEMYELTVFYNTKGAPTDKFAALKNKASQDLKINDYVKVIMPGNSHWNNFTGRVTYIDGNDDFATVVVENENGKIQQFDKRNLKKINSSIIKKANGPFEFEATKDSIDFIIDKEFLITLINAEPELKDTKLDPKKNEFDYIVDYKLSSNIEWKIDFETTNYGIKNMGISVPWQTISIDIEYTPKSEAAPIKNDMSFSIRHDIIGVDIVMESENFNSIWMKGLQIEGEDNVKATF